MKSNIKKNWFKDFLTWLQKPNPETTLVNWLKKKHEQAKAKRKSPIKYYGPQKTSEGTLRRSGKYIPPKKDNLRKLRHKIITVYNPFYYLEKKILEPIDTWVSKQALFSILEKLGYLGIVISVIAFTGGEEEANHNDEVIRAWQTVTTTEGQFVSGGRIEALQFLNSRPVRFPWLGWTNQGWYWNGEECQQKRLIGRRWSRQSLQDLSVPEAYLQGIHLCGANLTGANLSNANLLEAHLDGAFLWRANLPGANLKLARLESVHLAEANLKSAFLPEANLKQANLLEANLQFGFLPEANLKGANFQGTNLRGANLSNAYHLTAEQIKSACNWDEAIYRSDYNLNSQQWQVKEPDNQAYIEQLKQDRSSDPQQPVDCTQWNN